MGRIDTGHSQPRPRSRTRDPRVVTYRYKDRMVYVTPADTYEQAIQYAREVFPEDLRHIPAQQLSFTVISNTPKGKRTVRISSMAWKAVVEKLACYEIIDLNVNPEIILEDEREADYEDMFVAELKSSSPYLHPNDALPKPRTPSPVPPRSPSPTAKNSVKGWLEKVLP
ncbi:hypothetical protein DAEQUDRAFT_726379 [Daedalea quercina L-15889]|uniref:Uncharacterized protein n=1 Tax=Daedalea quercina L-15889 TaxID=1314783 RepID=A0A165QNK7_9APHY|nr:hypothetical protein DAEQUDRAFT_726379 [Daedalea quercina L-15889]